MKEIIIEVSDDFGKSLKPYKENTKVVGEIVRCKDCKHRGVGNNDFPADIEWPDEECPYECGDPFYNWLPPDYWYCANGERKSTKV